MRDHLAAVQEIILATSKNDFETVQKAAARIGYSETMGQMCTHMGAGAPGFTERALAFHHNADRIGEAAKAHDPAAVLTALGQTLGECTSCHASYKQSVVDDATWAAASGEQVPAMSHRMN
jgi:cytochrome c556